MNIDSTKRKVSRHESNDCSQQSIVSAMDRFVMAVNNMEDTVLVPSRLMDMSLNSELNQGSEGKTSSLTSGDLLSFYNMLTSVKNELIWGLGDGRRPEIIQDIDNSMHLTLPASKCHPTSVTLNGKLKHTESDSEEVESSSESDSGLDSLIADGSDEEPSVKLAKNFRRHLSGLFHNLQQLTDLSEFLTTRYQREVGSST